MDILPEEEKVDELTIVMENPGPQEPLDDKEEKWGDRHEKLALYWMKKAEDLASKHGVLALKNKKKHIWTALPPIILTSTMVLVNTAVSISQQGQEENTDAIKALQYVNASAFFVSSVMSGIHSFFDYATKKATYSNFSSRYNDVVSTIRYELTRDKNKRQNVDRFLQYIQDKMDALDENQPDV